MYSLYLRAVHQIAVGSKQIRHLNFSTVGENIMSSRATDNNKKKKKKMGPMVKYFC